MEYYSDIYLVTEAISAIVVGVEHYDQPGWDVSGPVRNALAVVEWLLSINTAPKRIHLFASSANLAADKLRPFKDLGVIVEEDARFETIDNCLRDLTPAVSGAQEKLLLYWSGHGFTNENGDRIVFCRDYTIKRKNRIVNVHKIVRRLRSQDYISFNNQIFLIDACGINSESPYSEVQDDIDALFTPRQLVYFATPEGKYAFNDENFGLFTRLLLEVLSKFTSWPNHDVLALGLDQVFSDHLTHPYRIRRIDENQDEESLVGRKFQINNDSHISVVETTLLPALTPILVGRSQEGGKLDAAWTGNNINVMQIVGAPGSGKSTLLTEWLSRVVDMPADKPIRVFAWSFERSIRELPAVALNEFFVRALSFFSANHSSQMLPGEKGRALARALQSERAILVIDHIDIFQALHGQFKSSAGSITDIDLRELLIQAAHMNSGLCITTSRQLISDLSGISAERAGSINLKGLNDEDGAELLARLRVVADRSALRTTSKRLGGSPLILTLLGRFLAKHFSGSLVSDAEISLLGEDGDLGGRFSASIRSLILRYHGRPEMDVLRALSLFDGAADKSAMAQLCGCNRVKGVWDNDFIVGDRTWNRAIFDLALAGLIDAPSSGQQRYVSCPVAIRECVSTLQLSENPEASKSAHSKLFEHYARRTDASVDSLEDLVELYSGVRHGCLAGRHEEAFRDLLESMIHQNNYANLFRFGSYAIELNALAYFFLTPFWKPLAQLEKSVAGEVCGLAGFCLQAVGRMNEAELSIKASYEFFSGAQNLEETATASRNLAELLNNLGRVKESQLWARRGHKIASENGYAAIAISCLTEEARGVYLAGNEARASYAGDWVTTVC